MNTPCMCGGCDRCLKDQGFATEAEQATINDARVFLRAKLIALATTAPDRFAQEVEFVLGSGAHAAASYQMEAAAVAGDPVRIAIAANRLREVLIEGYVEENLSDAIAQINKQREEDRAWEAYEARKAA